MIIKRNSTDKIRELNRLTGNKLPKSYLNLIKEYGGRNDCPIFYDEEKNDYREVTYRDNFEPFGRPTWYFRIEEVPTAEELLEVNKDVVNPDTWCIEEDEVNDLKALKDYFSNHTIIYVDYTEYHCLVFNNKTGVLTSLWPWNEFVNENKESFVAKSWDDFVNKLG